MMSEEEGLFQDSPEPHRFQGNPESHGSADEPRAGQPVEWPRVAAQTVTRIGRSSPALFTAAGSLVTAVAAMLVARRRSKRRGMAAMIAGMPSSIAGATEQMSQIAEEMMKNREQLAHRPARGRMGSNPLRAILALGAVALAGWGLKRSLAQQG